jgi:hypothetical protein
LILDITGSYIGVLNFQGVGVGVGVVLIRLRREEIGFVGQEGRGLSADSGINFNNLQIKFINNCLA